MDEICKKYIKSYKTPLTKSDLPSEKAFTRTENFETFTSHLSKIEDVLSKTLVERRFKRIKGEFIEDKNLVKLEKPGKAITKHFGFRDPHLKQYFLYPEEALYLIETNKLEVFHDGLSLSIQEIYQLVFQSTTELSWTKYQIFKNLVSLGYRLVRYDQFCKRVQKVASEEESSLTPQTSEDINKKRPLESECAKSKRICLRNEAQSSRAECTQQASDDLCDMINDLFEKIQEAGPKQHRRAQNGSIPDYKVFLLTNYQKTKPDYNLYIRADVTFDNESTFEDIPNVYVFSSLNWKSFYVLKDINSQLQLES